MKLSKKIAMLMGAILVSGMIFTGCSNNNEQNSSHISSGDISSVAESSPTSSANEYEISSTVQSTVGKPNSSASSQDTASTPSDAEFETYFEKNPIAVAHNEESGAVYTNNDMLQVEEKFAGIWSKEVDHAYELCEKKLPANIFATVKAEHEAWLSTQHADLADIRADGQQAGGSMGSIQIASKTAEYYQKEAKKLYKTLYQNNIDFQYQF